MKIIILLFILNFVSINAQEPQRFINVNGVSQITTPADEVRFNIYIKTVDDEVERSRKENENSLNELMEILRNNGIDSSNIEISPISIGKNYVYENDSRIKTQKGFYTSLRVAFTLKDMSKYFNLIDTLSLNSSFDFNSNYKISNYEEVHKNAYIQALNAAKEKAEYMAKTLGLNIGDVLEIDELNKDGYPNPFNTASRVESPTIFAKVTIKRSVRVKFELKN